jgi:hypothetical protein
MDYIKRQLLYLYIKYYKTKKNGLFILLLASWLLTNMLQAIYTEIDSDEAYYFLYSKHLDWGYFDHPPMVALLVRISSSFFNGNLGVRFITVLLQILTLILIWLQLEKKIGVNRSAFFFFIISASLVMFTVYGFTTTPDAPLLFFTALFLYGYKQFLINGNWAFTLLISITMAALIYSKYQGVLVIGFVIMSNIRLLLNSKFLIAIVLALALCIPHFYWQYTNGFPSFKYQLVSRSEPFKWDYTLEYLPNQLAAFNPFTFAAVLYVLFKYKPVQKFERAQYFVILGFILFFWITTFRGHAEPQWTVAASVPIIILLNNKLAIDDKLRNYVQKFVAGSLFLILIARILLVTSLLPAKLGLWGKETQYRAIEKIAKDKPVIFTGSYQDPSLYTFFTGKPATVISSLTTRQTQFDIWHLEQDWENKPVFINGVFEGKSKAYTIGKDKVVGFYADSIQTTNQLKIEFEMDTDSLRGGDSENVHFIVENPTQRDINFIHPNFPIKFQSIMIGSAGVFEIEGTVIKNITVLKRSGKVNNEIKFTIPYLPTGNYKFGLSCGTMFGPTLNSDFKKVILFQ